MKKILLVISILLALGFTWQVYADQTLEGTLSDKSKGIGVPVTLKLEDRYTMTIPGTLKMDGTGNELTLEGLENDIGQVGLNIVSLVQGAQLVVTVKSDNGYQLVNDKTGQSMNYTLTVAGVTSGDRDIELTTKDGKEQVELIRYDPSTSRLSSIRRGMSISLQAPRYAGRYTDVLTFVAKVEHRDG